MKQQIVIFESNKLDGIMSRNKKFYSKNLTQDDINNIFLKTRINLGKKYGFDGKKMFQAVHKTSTPNIDYPDGKYIVINETHMTKDDYWYEELAADILIISSDYPNIVIGNQTGDCPIVIAEDRKLGVMALSHCGAAQINIKIPQATILSLIKEYRSNPKNIYVYISTCAKKEKYIYETYPNWATNNHIWINNIEKRDHGYHIDLVNAIIEQLVELGIENIDVSKNDSITSPNYSSHYAYYHGTKEKSGQSFVGAYYKKRKQPPHK